MVLNPKDTSVFYVGGNQITRVVDWQNNKTTPYSWGSADCHPDIRALTLVHATAGDSGTLDRLYVGNDGGISKSLNGNGSWTNINGDNLILTDFYSIGSVDAAYERYGGGTVDNGFFSFNGSNWINAYGNAESTRTKVDHQNPQYVYTHALMLLSKTYRSPFAGDSFPSSYFYYSTSGQEGESNRALELNPINPNSLYAGAHDIFKTISVRDSINYSVVQIPVHINQNDTIISSKEKIISLAVSPEDTNIIYLAYNGPHWDIDSREHKLLKTLDEGQNYFDLLDISIFPDNEDLFNALHSIGITDICLSPTDTNKVWVSLGGFDDAGNPSEVTKRIYYSCNAGNYFEDISNGLPNFPVNCITYWGNDGNDRLFAGTDIGVYYRDAEMNRWVPFTTGMPKTIVSEIVVLPDHDIIRASTYGRGIYESDLECAFFLDTLMITSDTTWITPFTADRSILVKSPAVLTIQTTVVFPPAAKIMVEPGATLIVDGGELTNACFNMWQGIEVWGNQNLPQTPSSNQGYVSIRNGSIIKNSRFGVSTGATDSEGNLIWSTVGGIINGLSSTFKNNYKDVQFMPYSYPNFSLFQDVVFETTSDLIDGKSYPSDHVSMCGVHGIMFQGCEFKNTTQMDPTAPKYFRGNGIKSIDAEYTITDLCLNQPPPCSNPVISTFTGLNYGILTYNSNPTNIVTIEKSEFIDNHRGVYLGSTDYATFTENYFQIPVWNESDTCYGLYIGYSTGYHVEGNIFNAPGNPLLQPGQHLVPKEIGIIIDNSGGQPNEIYRNHFDSLDVAINAQRVNRYDDGSVPGGGQEEGTGTYTGLVLKCNTYNNNSYDEMVIRENPTGIEGIARDQGSPSPLSDQDLAGNTFSPYHESAQIAETDIKNEGNFVNYYHHKEGSNPTDPNVEPDYYTLSLVLPVEKLHYYDTLTSCPSHIESGGSQEEMKGAMAVETDSIDLLVAEHASLLDGGDTETMNDDIFFSLPPDALPLHQDLLGESPYLSDTVMKSAIDKEDILPNAMIRDILVANPHSAKSTEVIDKLNDRFIPMPDPMMDEILAGQLQISAKEILEGDIAEHKFKRQNLFNNLVRSYKADTINISSQDSLISFLQGETSLKAKYLLAFEYIGLNDTVNAISTLNAIPNSFTLSDIQQVVYNEYLEYFGILIELKTENKSILELDSGQITLLQDLVASGHEPVKSYARNILLANQLTEYHEPILFPDLNNLSGSKPITIPEQETSNTYFKLYPNPAKHFAIIEYYLLDYHNPQNHVTFVITNQEGKVMERIVVQKQQDQFILNTTGYVSGNYICSMFSGRKIFQSQKFVIIR